MKRPFALLLFSLLTGPPLSAQESAPGNLGLDLIPGEAAKMANPDAELPLIPDLPEPARKPSAPRETKPKPKSKTAAAEDLVEQRVRMRAAKTKALRDPTVQAEWERAEAAPTEYERRAALKNYYRALFSRMAKFDHSLDAAIKDSQARALARLEQTHIAPTEPPTHSVR